ncbi:MAG: DUF4198 domain-containing protein [Desulfobacteraceae bacterium]
MKKTTCVLVFSLLLMITAAGSAFGHTLWLNLSDHYPHFYDKFGAGTHAYAGWGHRYPVDGFLEFSALESYALVGPGGKKHKLTPNPGGLLATDIKMKNPGVYFIGAVKKPGFYTMYESGGRIHHKTAPKTGLDNVVLSVYYEEYAKSLIDTGNSEKSDLKRQLGHNLEIIPLENPKNIEPGDKFPVKVMFEGKPAKFVQVLGTYSGFAANDDFAFATKTDQNGVARVRILHRGHWLLKAWKKVPAGPDYRDKCNRMSYSATLTFGVR